MPHSSSQPRRARPWLLLAAVVLVGGPLHVGMGLTADAALYDLQARVVAEGGTLYEDVVEPNLPGVVWVHGLVRGLLGHGSEVLRLFDLVVFAATTMLLALHLRNAGRTTPHAVWTAAVLFVLYFSLSEWCHCQRDIWMLLPVLLAVTVRWAFAGATGAGRFSGSFTEGTLWAAAFWLKPHVAVPALCVMAVSGRGRTIRNVAVDLAGVLLGGAFVGALGTAWLVRTGTWPWFWEMLLEWNPEYLAVGRSRWTWDSVVHHLQRTWPWPLLHLAAAPAAATFVWRRVTGPRDEPPLGLRAMLATLYLAWLTQTVTMQRLFDYVQTPPLLLAVAVLACVRVPRAERNVVRAAGVAFAALVVLASPLFRPSRLACWPTVLAEGSTPEVRDRLGVMKIVGWRELAEVERFLRDSGMENGEVVAHAGHLVYLHAEGGFDPPTRYAYLAPLLRCFPSRHAEIASALAESDATYVVSSLVEGGVPVSATRAGDVGPPAFPPGFAPPADSFPWSHPVVFRSGRYLVHRIERPLGRVGLDLVLDRRSGPLPARVGVAELRSSGTRTSE